MIVLMIVLLVIVSATAVYVCYNSMEKLSKLQYYHDDLHRRYETLQHTYNAMKKDKEMKKDKDISYWFSLLRNPDRGKFVIAQTGFEEYGDGFDANGRRIAYSKYMSAKMYGDGRIYGAYYDSSHDRDRNINRQPQTNEEIAFFFGEIQASQLWAYYEFYCDFVKGRENIVSNFKTQDEKSIHNDAIRDWSAILQNQTSNHQAQSPKRWQPAPSPPQFTKHKSIATTTSSSTVAELQASLRRGACVYLSGAIVLESATFCGKKCVEISGLEGEHLHAMLNKGCKDVKIGGKAHVLLTLGNVLAMEYILSKSRVSNIFDATPRELIS